MSAIEVQVGSTITNGSSAIQVTERVAKDKRWGTSGWRGMCISLEAFGGNTGASDFVADYLLTGWYHVPFEWRPCLGGATEERYVWANGYKRLQREVRTAPRLAEMEANVQRMADELGVELTVQPTVNGIRGHRVTTPEEDEVRRRLTLEATPLAPFPVDCRAEHGVGHPDCPKCWRWSERNPNRVARP